MEKDTEKNPLLRASINTNFQLSKADQAFLNNPRIPYEQKRKKLDSLRKAAEKAEIKRIFELDALQTLVANTEPLSETTRLNSKSGSTKLKTRATCWQCFLWWCK